MKCSKCNKDVFDNLKDNGTTISTNTAVHQGDDTVKCYNCVIAGYEPKVVCSYPGSQEKFYDVNHPRITKKAPQGICPFCCLAPEVHPKGMCKHCIEKLSRMSNPRIISSEEVLQKATEMMRNTILALLDHMTDLTFNAFCVGCGEEYQRSVDSGSNIFFCECCDGKNGRASDKVERGAIKHILSLFEDDKQPYLTLT